MIKSDSFKSAVSMRRFALQAVFLAGVSTTLVACGSGEAGSPATQPSGAKEAVAVVLAPVRVESLDRTISVPGQLYGDEEATISAKVPGRVRDIHVDVGDRLPAGAALAQIDPIDYELIISQRELALAETLATLGLDEIPPENFDPTKVATVERTSHEANNAKAKLERARQLHEQDPPLISDQDFADISTAQEVAGSNYAVAVLEAKSLLTQARARSSELDAAHQRLRDTTVRAPGVFASPAPATVPATQQASTQALPRFAITERLVSQGEYVSEGDPLYRLVADNPIKFRAGVSDIYVPEVRLGQLVNLRVEGYDQTFTGRVNRVNPSINLQNQTFQIEVLIDNPEHLLKPGAFARAAIVVGQDAGVTFVPKSSIVSFAGVDRVFTVMDGKAVEHKVRPLLDTEREDYVALAEPLKDVQDVVTTGNQRLANEVPITLQRERSAQVPTS